MKKILVPTDFSPESKSAIRFAMLWASEQNLELVFIHILNILIPTRWSKMRVEQYIAGEIDSCHERFKKFISGTYKKMKIKPGVYYTIIVHEYDTGKTILEYCKKDAQIDCICISTSGAGKVMKLFGTNTSFLVSKSKIPVLAIPKNYKADVIKRVLYPTDFTNYKDELARVIGFASAFKAPIDVIHFCLPGNTLFDEKTIEAASGIYKPGLKVSIIETTGVNALAGNLEKQIKIKKPSVTVMFTNQERNLFQKIFFGSHARELSFRLTTPLLVFPKIKSPAKIPRHELA